MIGIIGAMDEEVKKLREMIQNGKVVKKSRNGIFLWNIGKKGGCRCALWHWQGQCSYMYTDFS